MVGPLGGDYVLREGPWSDGIWTPGKVMWGHSDHVGPWSQTSNSRTPEIIVLFCFLSPSLWYFIMAAWPGWSSDPVSFVFLWLAFFSQRCGLRRTCTPFCISRFGLSSVWYRIAPRDRKSLIQSLMEGQLGTFQCVFFYKIHDNELLCACLLCPHQRVHLKSRPVSG